MDGATTREKHMSATYVTDGKKYLIQVDADNEHGFYLTDGETDWAGGFGSGMTTWKAVDASSVPGEIRADMDWILENL